MKIKLYIEDDEGYELGKYEGDLPYSAEKCIEEARYKEGQPRCRICKEIFEGEVFLGDKMVEVKDCARCVENRMED